MNPAIRTGATREKSAWLRVLGVDPAAAGPTGYGIVESDGRLCRMLHYGALKITAKRQKECSGAALQDVHALLCRLIEEFAPDVMAVESVFTALNMRTAQMQAMVRALLSMTETPEPADAADALAVALCHLQIEQARKRFGLPDVQTVARLRSLASAVPSATTRTRAVGATRITLPAS
jgi:crossover junction endodeoxyribonuclease RuvC